VILVGIETFLIFQEKDRAFLGRIRVLSISSLHLAILNSEKMAPMARSSFFFRSSMIIVVFTIHIMVLVKMIRWFQPDESVISSYFTQIESVKQMRERQHSKRPLLESLVREGSKTEIVGDVQFLMDFAVVGYPKTATTTMLSWLSRQEEILMYNHEIYYLTDGEPADMVRAMYALPAGTQYKRGYKAPRDIYVPRAIDSFHNYFPQTKLIVGIRHPVLWFESFYNYRIRSNVILPPPNTMIGKCSKAMAGVCTDQVRYMDHLSIVGKTERTNPAELQWLSSEMMHYTGPRLENPIFLYEISQMEEPNPDYATQYREDLQDFLGLRQPLEPLVSSHKRHADSPFKHLEIDICDAQHAAVHDELLSISRNASIWIRDYFVPLPEVHISCPEHFHDLLMEWMIDPCIARRSK
jgi:hypothetical protein